MLLIRYKLLFGVRRWNFLVGVLIVMAIFFGGCSKEYSEENSDPATGSLTVGDLGDCLPKNLVGIYEVNKLLAAKVDYIEVTLHVTGKGTYSIQSDTINGFYFGAAGVITDTGMITLKLGANGTPLAEGTNTFTISFDSTQCSFNVIVAPLGTSSPAIFNFVSTGSPASCSGAVPSGIYATGQILNATNTVNLTVAVTQIGSYSITTIPINGMTFTGTGRFTSTGIQTITLMGAGVPLNVGNYDISVSNAAGNACSFVVPVITPTNYQLICGTEVITGSFIAGVPLSSSVFIIMSISTSAPAIINLTSNTVNGMTFTGTANVTTAGISNILITGTGTPVSAGITSMVFTVGTSSCTVLIPIQ